MTGTGFFIKIPDIGRRAILTARHNLVGDDGTFHKILRIGQIDNDLYIENSHINGYDIFVSAPEQIDRPSGHAIQYGVIVLPSLPADKGIDGFGFDFALKLGLDDLRGRPLAIYGYSHKDPYPVTSSGVCIGCRDDILEHDSRTVLGYSGSPVLMAYNGTYAAIAIQ
jgi:V8-like Glu-specific endopeptidase